MAQAISHPLQTEFYHRFPENFVLVENLEGGVRIRAARNNFSERRKAMFIRELAAEAFIPDEYAFFNNTGESSFLGVRWVIDTSWIQVPAEVIRISWYRFRLMYFSLLITNFIIMNWLLTRWT